MRPPEYLWPTVSLRGGPVVPTSGTDLGELITAHAVQLSHCYAYGVERHPTLLGQGQLVVRVDRNGSVLEAQVNGDVAEDSDVRWCIADEALRWKLQPSETPHTIRRSLDLHRDP